MNDVERWLLVLALLFAGTNREQTFNAVPVADPARTASVSDDSVIARAHLVQSLSEFHVYWQRMWKESEKQRARLPGSAALIQRRSAYYYCQHRNKDRLMMLRLRGKASRIPEYSVRKEEQYGIISSDPSAFAVCPSWALTTFPPGTRDESTWHDLALLDSLMPAVREARLSVIGKLQEALLQWPMDGWLSGQLVRLQVDQHDLDGAKASAESCRGERWWCEALRGYTAGKHGEIAEADRTFASARQHMTPAARCAWSSVQQLMSAGDSASYANTDCSKRDAMNETLWWLSDPLYRDPGNERRVEQEMRRVDIALRQAVSQDERYHWEFGAGGDALEELLLRYGWPSYAGWGSAASDHGKSNQFYTWDYPRADPYTTFEYLLGRVHTMPALDAVRAPFSSASGNWNLIGENEAGNPVNTWWPREHYKPARRLIQLPDGQNGMFRRQDHILFASAVTLTHPALQVDSLLIDVMMLATTSAARIDSIAQRAFVGGETAVLQGPIRSEPQLVAIEGKGVGQLRIDARTRFAIAPPPTLASMKPGEIAVSEPILVEARKAADLSALGDSLIEDMLGNTTLDPGHRRVGLYWESYGVAQRDTVQISIRVAPNDSFGFLRRLGAAVNMAGDPRSGVLVSWTEPDLQHAARTLVGPVPVMQRAIVLNLGQLAPGAYFVEVSVERKGSAVARSQRPLVITQ